MREGPTTYEQRAEEWFSDPVRVPGYVAAHVGSSPESYIFNRRIELVLQELADHRGGTLVDMGCGPGMLLAALGRSRPGDFETLGIDISPSMVEEATRQVAEHREARALVGRAEELPLPDGVADVVLALGILELADPHRVLAEAARVLRPDGTAVLSMVSPSSPARLWDQRVYEPLRRRRGWAWVDGWDPAEIPWSEPDLMRTLHLHGLRPLRVRHFVYDPVWSPFDRRLPGFRARAMRRLEWLAGTPLRRLGSYFLVRARKAS
ncbi:MAG: class I SAM-dependent methyltransferase [Miltoncostaeaceae bacterium]